jgi:hypothetical protein
MSSPRVSGAPISTHSSMPCSVCTDRAKALEELDRNHSTTANRRSRASVGSSTPRNCGNGCGADEPPAEPISRPIWSRRSSSSTSSIAARRARRAAAVRSGASAAAIATPNGSRASSSRARASRHESEHAVSSASHSLIALISGPLPLAPSPPPACSSASDCATFRGARRVSAEDR